MVRDPNIDTRKSRIGEFNRFSTTSSGIRVAVPPGGSQEGTRRSLLLNTGMPVTAEPSRTLEKYLFGLVGLATILLAVLTYFYVEKVYVDPSADMPDPMYALCVRGGDLQDIELRQEKSGKLVVTAEDDFDPSQGSVYKHGNCGNLHGEPKVTLDKATLYGSDSILGRAIKYAAKCCVVGLAKE